MATFSEILRVLDRGAEAYVFPMLDDGYVYLAATRMSLHRSEEDWALVSDKGIARTGLWRHASMISCDSRRERAR